MSFWTSTKRVGRKDHRCEACWRTVPKGEASYAVAGVCDGDFSSYRQCVPCHDLIDRLYACGVLYLDESFMLHELPDLAQEADEPWPPTRVSDSDQAQVEAAIG